MKKIIIKVKGMVCEGCENRLKKSLEKISGVNKVTASYKNENIEVECTDELLENEIINKIKDIGFEIK